jgi:acyl-CoA thioesterase-1
MKNKLVFVLWVAFSLVFLACATTGGSTSGEETIVCLGDSMTSGYSATVVGKNDKSKSWPAFLQNKVNIPVINAGMNGESTAQKLAHMKRDVLSKNPRIVIIETGGNDGLMKIPLSTTKNNLQKIIDMVNDGRRKIYLARFYPLWNDQVDDMFNTLASSNNIEQIDYSFMNDIWGVKEYISADGLHPNAKGYEIMADNIFKVLKPYLEANNLLKD